MTMLQLNYDYSSWKIAYSFFLIETILFFCESRTCFVILRVSLWVHTEAYNWWQISSDERVAGQSATDGLQSIVTEPPAFRGSGRPGQLPPLYPVTSSLEKPLRWPQWLHKCLHVCYVCHDMKDWEALLSPLSQQMRSWEVLRCQ